MQCRHGVKTSLAYEELPKDMAEELKALLFRHVKELCTNAIKHGKAKNIRIELVCKADETVLTVESDGLEFPEEPGTRGTGMGLHIMNHRADIIGASLDIRKAARGGTIATCSFRNHGR